MSNDLVKEDEFFTREKIELMKQTICKGSTDEEFELFLHACKRTGLDPFMRQIYAVKRWDAKLGRETMTMQTGIDGYRLIGERTQKYAPGKEPTYTYDKNGKIESATAYVKKMTPDGTWHEVSASAYYSEYVQKKKDGSPVAMWANMPRNQLAKCAEALALRKSFPAEMSGLYTKEEMEQADIEVQAEKVNEPVKTCQAPIASITNVPCPDNTINLAPEIVTEEMEKDFLGRLKQSTPEYREKLEGFVLNNLGKTCIQDVTIKDFNKLSDSLNKHLENIGALNVGARDQRIDSEVSGPISDEQSI